MKSDIFRVDGKKAVVTGASRGIGRATAIALARQGAQVALVSRDAGKMDETADIIRKAGSNAVAYCLDVSDEAKVCRFFETIKESMGGLDIFVNNAAVTTLKFALDTTDEDMDRLFRINFKGAMYCLQGAANLMASQNKGGAIVIVTSVNAIVPLPMQAMYSSTKCALEGIMRCFALELAPYGIRVNSVAPGSIDTDMNSIYPREVLDMFGQSLPLGRVGTPEEIADVVCFAASNAARYMTGSTIVVDGGLLVRSA